MPLGRGGEPILPGKPELGHVMKAWEWLANRGFGKAAQLVDGAASDEPLVIQLHRGGRQDAAER
jgi:hypothetical protein